MSISCWQLFPRVCNKGQWLISQDWHQLLCSCKSIDWFDIQPMKQPLDWKSFKMLIPTSWFFHFHPSMDLYRQEWKAFLLCLQRKKYGGVWYLIRIFNNFVKDIFQGLPFFHVFSACKTSPMLYGKEASFRGNAWMYFSKSKKPMFTFTELNNSPLAKSKENIHCLSYSYYSCTLEGIIGTLI